MAAMPSASMSHTVHATGVTLPQVITTVQFTPGIGDNPAAIGVNPVTGYVYVANTESGNVSVVSGTQVVANVRVGSYPQSVAVNPVSGKVYVANRGSDTVSVISGTQTEG